MSERKSKSRRQASGRQRKRAQGAHARGLAARSLKMRVAKRRELLNEQWLREMRRKVRAMFRQLDELEVILRALDVLESKQVMRSWFNGVVPALGVRPIDLCQTAKGRQAVLRELGRIEHGVHS